jgi:hemerythrin superfamily protein
MQNDPPRQDIGTAGSDRMNALNLLKKDHAEVKSLFDNFERTSKDAIEKRVDLVDQIRRELHLHTRVEEEIFYPAIKAANGDGARLVSEALKEHKHVDQLLTQLSRLKPTNVTFDEKMESLIENVDHHVEVEEGEIFRFAEENCSEAELNELGGQIERRKKILEQQLAA